MDNAQTCLYNEITGNPHNQRAVLRLRKLIKQSNLQGFELIPVILIAYNSEYLTHLLLSILFSIDDIYF
jgi:hypothetical protein